ncbi:MAG: TatD family hydrolase [Crocinitomicaceae bacterium]|nr:TatD family hydrolase [Crocinitomicaceae bacterium]
MLIDIHTHHLTGRQIEVVSRTFGDPLENYFSFGIHPWEAEKWGSKVSEIRLITENQKCLALGEIGLDKLKGPEFARQKEIFIQQVVISEEIGLPVILHCVHSWNELKQLKKILLPKQQWIYHGFSKVSILEEVINEEIMISIGTALLTNRKLQEKITTIPIDRLFLETDAADIPIEIIYAKVSELINLPLPLLEAQIEANFKRIFTKWTIG